MRYVLTPYITRKACLSANPDCFDCRRIDGGWVVFFNQYDRLIWLGQK